MYLNQANFAIKFQSILEKYYLKPLNGADKNNLKDGSIEREIHGAQHASEATLWSLVMNNLLQTLTPDYVNASLETIAKHIGSNTQEVLLLILMTMGCHDAARKGEGQDIWESQSAEIALETLKELGLEEKHARPFSAAIVFKDKPDEYKNALKSLGIEEKDYNKFDYIRKIVNLGDNLDLMRCIKNFESKYIFNTLATVEGFNENHHEMIMKLIKEIHQFIYDQGNMLFSCTVKDLNGNDVVSHKSHFSKKEKVKYEHAENVFAALFSEALKNPFFESFIKNFSVPKTIKYEGEMMFNPFIHGTNTSILSILPKSEFNIMSPLEMMDDYQAVSMTGELTRGGYDVVGSTVIKEGGIGKTSFGIMSANGLNSYTLEDIISNYANMHSNPSDDNLCEFKSSVSRGLSQAFSNINLLLIYFTRARQMHNSLEEVITEEEVNRLREQMEATSQFFYFIQLLGTYIHPNFEALKQSGMEQDITDAANTLLTFENIVNKIINNKINMKEIVANPTAENLRKALSVLEFPAKCTIKSGFSGRDKDIELPITQFFCLEPNYPAKLYDRNEPNYTFYRMSQNWVSGYKINDLLEGFLSAEQTSEFFIKLGEKAKQHLIGFDDRVRLFEKLVKAPQYKFQLTNLQGYFLEKKYPIVLVSENEDKISLYNKQTDEYRSNSALKLGFDVKIIATDTNEHRLEIMKYLELHHNNNIQVVLFDDLKKSKKSHKKPSAPHNHSDGVPTLKWLSAQKVPKSLAQSVRENSSEISEKRIQSPKLFSEQNISEVSVLLNDVKTYQDIQFEPCCTYRCASPTHHAAIELLVKAGFKQKEFKSLIGYSAKDNIMLAKLIVYLAELNLSQFYKEILENNEFKEVLALFFKANIKEGISEELLGNRSAIKLIYEQRYYFSKKSHCLNAIIALCKYQPNLFNEEANKEVLHDSLSKLIIYFDKNKLQKYYNTLLKNSDIAFSLLWAIENNNVSNEIIESILDNQNITQAISKHYISISDLQQLEAGFILSKLGIEINWSIDYERKNAIHLLNKQGFTDKSYYLKAMNSKGIIAALSDYEISTLFQINAVFTANELHTLNNEELDKIKKYPQLTKMLAFANNKDEWNLYSEFYGLLGKLEMLSTNQSTYNVAITLIKDINNEIDQCFSFANNVPNKMDLFSVKCNKLIEVARAVLELNTGLVGVRSYALTRPQNCEFM